MNPGKREDFSSGPVRILGKIGTIPGTAPSFGVQHEPSPAFSNLLPPGEGAAQRRMRVECGGPAAETLIRPYGHLLPGGEGRDLPFSPREKVPRSGG